MTDPAHSQKGAWVADLQADVMDRTGSIEGRVWDNAEEIASLLHEAVIVKLEGEVEEFQGRLQVRVLRLRLAEANESDRADMFASTKRNVEVMMQTIDDAIEAIEDEKIKRLLLHFFGEESFRQAFSTAPAARRIHHAYLGGLLEHTYEILQLSIPLLELYPEIKHDLLVAGILLHDVGKLREFSWETDIEYSDEGRLLGHVVPGAEMVASAIKQIDEFPTELAIRIQHLILSHHGRYEWGSPRRPKTLEAIALHHLENLDGQVNRFLCLMAAARQQGRSWTEFDYMLGRSLYAGSDGDLVIEERGMTE